MEDSDIKSALCQTTKLKLFHLFNICIYKRYTRNRTHRGSNSEISPRANHRVELNGSRTYNDSYLQSIQQRSLFKNSFWRYIMVPALVLGKSRR